MLETVNIHIGLPKTGSTALQSTMAANHEFFRDQGILYPTSRTRYHNFLRHYFSEDSLKPRRVANASKVMSVAQIVRIANEEFQSLERQLEAFEGKTLLLSSELFSGMPEEACTAMRDYVEGKAETIRVIAYVRHPLAFAVSFAQERVRLGHSVLEQEERKQWRRQLRSRLEGWIAAVGKERLVLVPYERSILIGGSTVSDTLSRIGYQGEIPETEAEVSNSSLTMAATVVKSRMNDFANTRDSRLGRQPYLGSIPGPRYAFPQETIERSQRAVEEDLAWVKEKCGVELPAMPVEARAELASYFTEEVTAAILAIAGDRSHFRSELEADCYEHALRSLRADGLLPKG